MGESFPQAWASLAHQLGEAHITLCSLPQSRRQPWWSGHQLQDLVTPATSDMADDAATWLTVAMLDHMRKAMIEYETELRKNLERFPMSRTFQACCSHEGLSG